ncbi:hypothetical protein HYN48_14190 [Flavobacterium magnum]|uniref:Uncharacterized protein n=1 Tax=Flavobacterium magnum TaxID=2162713 RepID=A0A2S0RIP9_9FLAO|nr:hypothetical protein [Flavobacterium magnum]AWA31150.1 hypothetical protein HYN48_14190 [Flavobacterium magnum]
MRKFLFILALSSLSCNKEVKNTESENGVISESDLYSVINSLQNCALKGTIYYSENDTPYDKNFIETYKLDSIFSTEDVDFFRKQMKKATDFKLDIRKTKCDRIITKHNINKMRLESKTDEIFWEKIRMKYGPLTCLAYIKLPIFSKDKNYVIFSSNYSTGPHSLGGSIEIYKKINNKWKRFHSLSGWVS